MVTSCKLPSADTIPAFLISGMILPPVKDGLLLERSNFFQQLKYHTLTDFSRAKITFCRETLLYSRNRKNSAPWTGSGRCSRSVHPVSFRCTANPSSVQCPAASSRSGRPASGPVSATPSSGSSSVVEFNTPTNRPPSGKIELKQRAGPSVYAPIACGASVRNSFWRKILRKTLKNPK